jgi:hypothetical protein
MTPKETMKPSGRKLLVAAAGIAVVSYVACKEQLRTGNLMPVMDDSGPRQSVVVAAPDSATDASTQATESNGGDAGDAGGAKILGQTDGLKTQPKGVQDAGSDTGKPKPILRKMGAFGGHGPVISGNLVAPRD